MIDFKIFGRERKAVSAGKRNIFERISQLWPERSVNRAEAKKKKILEVDSDYPDVVSATIMGELAIQERGSSHLTVSRDDNLCPSGKFYIHV